MMRIDWIINFSFLFRNRILQTLRYHLFQTCHFSGKCWYRWISFFWRCSTIRNDAKLRSLSTYFHPLPTSISLVCSLEGVTIACFSRYLSTEGIQRKWRKLKLKNKMFHCNDCLYILFLCLCEEVTFIRIDWYFFRTLVSLGSDLLVRVSLTNWATFADLTDVTLADEDTNW